MNKNNKGNIAIIVAIVVVVVLGLLIVYFSIQGGTPSGNYPGASPVSGASIVKVAMAKGVDANGNAVNPTTSFSSKSDKTIYEVLTLQNVSKTTKISYIRYLNNKYVDSKVATPGTAGVTNFYFAFEKGVGGYPSGTYRIVNYVDDQKKSIETTYTFN